MTDPSIAALIPAAGLSSRMEAFKPLIEVGGQTLVERVVNLFESAGISDIVTVVGHRSDELIPVLERTASRWVFNPDHSGGMFTSIRKGLEILRGSCDAFFVLPVDIPLVRSLTVRQLMRAFQKRSSLICHPRFGSGRGHPPLIDSCLINEMLDYGGQGGMRAFLKKHADRADDIPVADAHIHMDLDTEEDLALLQKAFQRYTIPSPDECLVMLEHYFDVSSAVQKHCRAVAGVARRLGAALIDGGRSLDLDLLTASGLLHDICKGREDHAARAADALREAGFPGVAEVVAGHMDLQGKVGDTMDERALLYLSDKIVQEDRVVTLDERRADLMGKHGQNTSARERITERLDTAQRIQYQIEAAVGMSLERLLRDS
jgi:CTP:molybdopterin cytidylyltransferase MocA/HD superfamily phosphodiesterase